MRSSRSVVVGEWCACARSDASLGPASDESSCSYTPVSTVAVSVLFSRLAARGEFRIAVATLDMVLLVLWKLARHHWILLRHEEGNLETTAGTLEVQKTNTDLSGSGSSAEARPGQLGF